MAWRVGGLELTTLALGTVYLALEPGAAKRAWVQPDANDKTDKARTQHMLNATVLALVFIAATLKLAADSYSPFLYFQF
jgi:hypothetical protein